jgi:hypothetical protein
MHCGVEVTESSTNKQHHLSLYTRCDTPVFLKSKINNAGKCYTYSKSPVQQQGKLSDTHEGTPADHKAELRAWRLNGSMARASIVGLFCFSSVGVCGPHRVQRDSEVTDRIGYATIRLPCQ